MMYAPQTWPAKLGLVVPEYAVQTGDLPRVCVVSGVPTDNMVAMRWVWAPLWTAFFLLLWIVPFFVMRYLIGDRAAGYLPILPSVRRKYRGVTAAGVFGIIVGLFVMVTGFADGQPLIGIVGVALLAGGVYAASRWSRVLPVKRAAPGYIALPKAHPRFVAAFNGGRPVSQVPYSATPATFRTRTVFVVLGVILVVLFGSSAVVAAMANGNCLRSHVHPGVAAVDQEFARSRAEVSRINAETGGQGLTPSGAQELQAEHERLIADLTAIHVNSADRYALDAYSNALRSYDSVLSAAMLQQNAAGDAALAQANSDLRSAGASLDGQLAALPADCRS